MIVFVKADWKNIAAVFEVRLFTPASGLVHTCCLYLLNINHFTSLFS